MPPTPPCAYCRRRRAADRFRPFCSERCKMADLGQWLNGAYCVAGPPTSSDADHRDVAEPDEDDDAAYR